MGALRLVLGDQLSHDVSSLVDVDPDNDVILLCEVWEEATYVRHHKKKIAFLFAAMRHFAQELEQKGLKVRYVALDDEDNSGSFRGEVERAADALGSQRIVVTEPGEYRVLADIASWQDEFGVQVEVRDDDRFLCSLDEFRAWAGECRSLRMETFYRMMRRKYQILMDGEQPVGGSWNYDKDNRGPLSVGGLLVPDSPDLRLDAITQDVLELVADRFADHFGDLEPFQFAVTRDQALTVLNEFLDERLPSFGDFQDNMIQGQPRLYHAQISFYLNAGLLQPLEVVAAAEERFHQNAAPLNAVEGFIRQIIGWREYVRGIYWLKMPDYADVNFFGANRDLPWFYWSGETEMNCVRQCVAETKQNAYAHHIQRLMVLGNFALLAGIDPKQVNEWYLIVYADAYEWVELPNVTGMILFADGGYLGSKPYAAGGAYINRMSDYCQSCSFNVKQRSGPKACPFNYLYWNFLLTNRQSLRSNQRLKLAYGSLDRMDEKTVAGIRSDSLSLLRELSPLPRPRGVAVGTSNGSVDDGGMTGSQSQ